ncbi:hypothetical protein, partial [Mesorhizobium sp. M8A.F.Ca.ET.218.01.1.1]|uniref:hypothetical protein n=1 Tax=Mesorhizobium sp. M8A.F.Ca.ET.218.01.1.1 TaxID=2563971 RepID=UPI001AEE73B3
MLGRDDVGNQVSAELDGRIRRCREGFVFPAFRLESGQPDLQALFFDRQICAGAAQISYLQGR